jgi:dihydroorotate dehydrogenase (NAD+) catalytic subunit
VYEIYEAVDVPIVGVGGIETGRDALEYIMAGARAVEIGTALATRGMAVFEEVSAEIAEFMEERGVKSLSSIVGAAHG